MLIKRLLVMLLFTLCTYARFASADDSAPKLWSSAIANDNTERLAELLNTPRAAELVHVTSGNGKTALMVAAKSGDLELAQTLVRTGAALDVITATGGDAMMFAALGERVDVARWLLAQGATTDAVGSNGWTAVTIAAARGFAPMLDWLLSVDAEAAPVDVYGYTPLMRAVENGHADAATVLLDAGAVRINHQDEFGNTALHHAWRAGREDLVELLRAAGADASIVNREGQLPGGAG